MPPKLVQSIVIRSVPMGMVDGAICGSPNTSAPFTLHSFCLPIRADCTAVRSQVL